MDQHNNKHLTLALKLNNNIPALLGDVQWLYQALLNILTNAAQHTPSQGTITVKAVMENKYATIEIRDTGEGISDYDLPRIFDCFYRRDKARTTRGVGLGLSIAKKIIEAHRGTIAVESAERKGCTVKVLLPAAEVG